MMNDFTKEDQILHRAYTHLIEAEREIFKIKNLDSECAEWANLIRNICEEMQSHVEGNDNE